MKNTKAWTSLSLFFGFILLVPVVSFAFVDPQNYTCATLPNGAASCAGSTITFTGSNQARYSTTGSGIFYVAATTYYATYTVTGSGTLRARIIANAVDGTPVDVTGSQTDLPVVAPNNGANTWTAFYFDDTQGFVGTVSGICVSDHIGGCTPTPPPGPSTASTTAVTVDDPAEQLFNAFIIFFVSAAFLVWLMRK